MTEREPKDPVRGNLPPYRYAEGSADVPMLLAAAGLDVTKYGGQEFFRDRGLWELFELFSDGELQIDILGDEIQPSHQYARPLDKKSEFYEKMAQLRTTALHENGALADEMNKLARFCGIVLASYAEQDAIQIPVSGLVRPGINRRTMQPVVRFGDYRWESEHDIPAILEYGPGVNGKRFIDAQISRLAEGLEPFDYISISNGPFINQFLLSYLGGKVTHALGPQFQKYAANGKMFAGREDGMQRATESILASHQSSGGHDIADLILLTGLHLADRHELETTLRLSPHLLRHGGKLMIASPLEHVTPESVSFGEQIQWAKDAGCIIEWQDSLRTGDARLGKATTSGLAVLTKD